MPRKGNCSDNSVMKNFFGETKGRNVHGEKFEPVAKSVHGLEECLYYWNNKRMSLKPNGMNPVQHQTHSQKFNYCFFNFWDAHRSSVPTKPPATLFRQKNNKNFRDNFSVFNKIFILKKIASSRSLFSPKNILQRNFYI